MDDSLHEMQITANYKRSAVSVIKAVSDMSASRTISKALDAATIPLAHANQLPLPTL